MSNLAATVFKSFCLGTGTLLGLFGLFYASLNLLAKLDPGQVSSVSAQLPAAITRTARPLLDPKQSANNSAKAIALLSNGLRSNALDVRTVELLALGAQKLKSTAQAQKLMRLAAGLTPHYAPPHLWLFDQSMAARDFRLAASSLNVLFRTESDKIDVLLGAIDRVGHPEEFLEQIALQLKNNPPWLQNYIYWMSSKAKDINDATLLFQKMRNNGYKVTVNEISYLLPRLIELNRPMQAYALWIQSILSEELTQIAQLYNGNFASDPVPSPFDWSALAGSSASVGFEQMDEGSDRAIVFDFFEGRQTGFELRQVLLLGPGRWTLTGRVRVEEITAPRGIGWAINCRPAGIVTPLAPPFQKSTDSWTSFRYEFVVPNTGCDAQFLTLQTIARSEADHDFSGRLALSNLAIERLGALQAPVPPADPADSPPQSPETPAAVDEPVSQPPSDPSIQSEPKPQ